MKRRNIFQALLALFVSAPTIAEALPPGYDPESDPDNTCYRCGNGLAADSVCVSKKKDDGTVEEMWFYITSRFPFNDRRPPEHRFVDASPVRRVCLSCLTDGHLPKTTPQPK